jgi:predicted PurR-regulated permease PerM
VYTGIQLFRPYYILIVLACGVILLAGMKAASPILGPVLCAGFISILFIVLKHWLEKKGFSPRLAVVAVILLYFTTLAGFVLAVGVSLLQLASQLPLYQEGLESLLPSATECGQVSFADLLTLLPSDAIDLLMTTGRGVIALLGDLLTAALIVVFTPLFILAESAGLTRKLQGVIVHLSGRMESAERFGRQMVEYLVVRTEVNLANGVVNGLFFACIGVDFAILWGFLAFVLGYVVYVGFWLAVIPPMVLAWLEMGPAAALLVLIGAGIINTVAEYLLFPHLAGYQLNLSPLVIFLSIFFWWLILGAFGVLLAVPLTMAVQAILETWDETRWLGELLGNESP